MEKRGGSETTIKRHTPLGVSRNWVCESFLGSDHSAQLVNSSSNESSESMAFTGLRRDPYLFINDRGFHILAHCYSMAPYPSNAISGHGESASSDGLFLL
eukprot:SAG31_NODE_106_length_24954_cov_17.726413_18_plen_100_part_00